MAAKKKQRKQYYAVVRGRVNQPTIFSSWGDAHPRVTWYPGNVFKGFPTLEKACEYMKAKDIYQYATEIKPMSLDIVPENGSECYYAVANGANPGIYKRWYGADGASDETDMWKGACHKYFRTEAQAEAFIEDWELSVKEVCNTAAKRKQVGGLKLKDIEPENLETLLRLGDGIKAEVEGKQL